MLVTAFAAVPGSSPHSAAMLGMTAALRAEVDLVSLKTDSLPHVELVGDARMFRVPVGDAEPLDQRRIFDRAVARQLEAERYDVVHVRGPFEGALAAERKASLGFSLVYEMATFPDEALGAEVERRWAEAHSTCLEHADLVLVPTEAARRAAADTTAEDRVLVVPPGVDVGTFDWRPNGDSSVARLLYLGSFTADRDLATLLGAVRRIRGTREVQVLVAGETDRGRRARLREMVEAFGLGDVVDVRGEPSARTLPAIIAGADLCLATASEVPRFQSLGDLPQPLLEYLACHRPVVAAGVPGVAEVLRDEQEGLLYPPGDEAALAEAALEMLRDAGLRDRTTELGYRRVREIFSSGARRRRITDAYERLISGSQVADAWSDSFPEGKTGEHEMAAAPSGSGREELEVPDSAIVEEVPRPSRRPPAPPEVAATLTGDLSAPEALGTGDIESPPEPAEVTTGRGRGRDVEPTTSEMEIPDLEGEATIARVEGLVIETDHGRRPPTQVDTDPGSRP